MVHGSLVIDKYGSPTTTFGDKFGWAFWQLSSPAGVYVSLLANMGVLYHKTGQISRQFVKNVRDTALDTRDKRLQTQDTRPPAEKQRSLHRG